MLRKMAFSIDDPMMDMKISELGELLGTLQRQPIAACLLFFPVGKPLARGLF